MHTRFLQDVIEIFSEPALLNQKFRMYDVIVGNDGDNPSILLYREWGVVLPQERTA